MQNVMKKAQELAEAIAVSDVYLKMKSLEEDVRQDEEAAETVNNLMMKRQRVEDLLSSKEMDPDELKLANSEMVRAEQKMNENKKVSSLKAARKEFSVMMDNVNRILRLIITGEVREDDVTGNCSGNCSGCRGCG